MIALLALAAVVTSDFEVLFSGDAHIRSFAYFHLPRHRPLFSRRGLQDDLGGCRVRLAGLLAEVPLQSRAGFWQRSPYQARLEANVRFDAVQWKRVGLGVELANVFYYTTTDEVQRSHRLSLQGFLYGDSHALIVFFSWWAYDNQALRNRSNRGVAGLELSF